MSFDITIKNLYGGTWDGFQSQAVIIDGSEFDEKLIFSGPKRIHEEAPKCRVLIVVLRSLN